MQDIKKSGAYEATWGEFKFCVESREDEHWAGRLERGDRVLFRGEAASFRDLVEVMAAEVDARGILAVVDGKKRSVADFLVFNPI